MPIAVRPDHVIETNYLALERLDVFFKAIEKTETEQCDL
jgi:hypothetical protein